MNRLIALTVGIALSALLIAPVSAASNSVAGNQQARESGKQGKIKQTPQAAKTWHEREKKRYAAKKKAAAKRQEQLSNKSGI